MSALSRGAAHKWWTGFFQGHPFVKTVLKIISGARGGAGFQAGRFFFFPTGHGLHLLPVPRTKISVPSRAMADLRYPFCKDATGSVAAVGEQLGFFGDCPCREAVFLEGEHQRGQTGVSGGQCIKILIWRDLGKWLQCLLFCILSWYSALLNS